MFSRFLSTIIVEFALYPAVFPVFIRIFVKFFTNFLDFLCVFTIFSDPGIPSSIFVIS